MQNLVVGATGVLGGKICQSLRDAGESVRALVRTTSSPEAVERLTAMGAEIVVGDVKSPESLRAACHGVDTVFFTASAIGAPKEGDSFDTVDLDGVRHLIDAAKAEGVKRIVYISVLGIAGDFPMGRAKVESERALRESGIPYTILQSAVFMDSWLAPEMGFDYASGNVTVLGDGSTRQGWIHSTDVARVAVSAARSDAAANQVLHVTGPASLTMVEVVRTFEEVAGRPFEASFVPREALDGQRAGATNPWEETFAALGQRFAEGDPADVQPLPAGVDAPTITMADFARQLLGA
ncbi:MAG TPA: SDR family oxidoreductase [Gemmatimonadaceae bacterium]|nr:SDR family oxidoreductase [Gemmatimonadaceae bacterium]